ncbi:hypothetical protein MLD63_02550 (plasmid) [Paracoccus sp. TK19116]|uniref:Uncharacterized protein n=1 Tax=Paracoccus albicereus TaxID=2922394 RepID=A0ABT1MM16_9RHOB|nr:hypothetical protein [Paracoccus albicereus]MCQ0969317.1 hypothetical protein [Paracoccus albicereus]
MTRRSRLAPEVDESWHTLFVTRSFLNWLASTQVLLARRNIPDDDLIAEMLRRAADWAALTDLGGRMAKSDPHQNRLVVYDDWFRAPTERAALAEWCGLAEASTELPIVRHYGGGSSFDLQKKRDAPSEMDVLGRYLEFVDDPVFRTTLARAKEDQTVWPVVARHFPEQASFQ